MDMDIDLLVTEVNSLPLLWNLSSKAAYSLKPSTRYSQTMMKKERTDEIRANHE